MELNIKNLGKVELTSLPADYCWGENNINYNLGYIKNGSMPMQKRSLDGKKSRHRCRKGGQPCPS